MCLVCLCTVVLRQSKELGRFQIAILGPLSRGTGRRGLLPGACLLPATVDGAGWIESSLASRTGNRSSKQPVGFVVLVLCVRLCLVDVLWPQCGMSGNELGPVDLVSFFAFVAEEEKEKEREHRS